MKHLEFWELFIKKSRSEQEEFLKEHTYLLHENDDELGTLLHYFVDNGTESYIKMALNQGADINQPNNDGNTPLHIAAFLDDGPMIDYLIAKNANKEARNKGGLTPWLVACSMGSDMAAEFLLKHKVNVDATSKTNQGSWEYFLSHTEHHNSRAYEEEIEQFAFIERLIDLYQEGERLEKRNKVINDPIYRENLAEFFPVHTAILEQQEINSVTPSPTKPNQRHRL